MIPDGRTPVMVVTGFLGSGKTTLVNQLLKKQSESLVIVNEFGDVPVDHHLLEATEERAVALPNGCLCCRLRGDLEETLVGAAMRRRRGEIAGFDRVIVETSGIADPGPVAQTLFADQALARDFKLGPIVAVVDAADSENRKAAWDVARAQIAAADVVVLSKIDRPSARPDEVRHEIESLNATAACIEASFGALDPELLQKSGTDHVFQGTAAHAAGIHNFTLKFDNPVPKDLLERFLGVLVELRGADLLRVKGVVAMQGNERVLVQGVRHVFDRLRPVALPETGLVFVANRVEKSEVQALWQAMSNLKGCK